MNVLEEVLNVVITRRENQGTEVAVLELSALDSTPLPAFEAGAHVDVYVGEDLIRQYSLSNDPSDSSFYQIAVLNDPESRGGSKAIYDSFKEGDQIQISAPRNLFPLVESANKSILIGGGIGITPLVAMAHTLSKAASSFELHYCLRKKADGALMANLESHFAEQLQLHCSREKGGARIALETVLPSVESGVHIYVCGSSGLLDSIVEFAKSKGFPSEQIHFEYFSNDVDISGDTFEVYCAQSDKALTVGADESIATALKREGIRVQVSCEEGICGTCISDVLEGEPDHRDQFLSDEEKEDNDQMALCCSRSLSPKLVIDI